MVSRGKNKSDKFSYTSVRGELDRSPGLANGSGPSVDVLPNRRLVESNGRSDGTILVQNVRKGAPREVERFNVVGAVCVQVRVVEHQILVWHGCKETQDVGVGQKSK